MNWADIVSPPRILCAVEAPNRRGAIELLSELLASKAGGDAEAVNEVLMAREKLGSTVIGRGVMLPHAKCAAVSAPVAAMLILKPPLDCATPDDVPVDIVMGFLAPAQGNDLSLLAGLVKELRDENLLRDLRRATGPRKAHAVLRSAAS